MKKVAIFFRNKSIPNVFRNVILKSLSSDFSKYIICSAFFQHKYTDRGGRSRGEFNTSEELLKALYAGRCYIKKDINIYGLYESGRWPRQYDSTCQHLFTEGCSSCMRFSFFKFKNKKSHAKIFIAKDSNDNPKLAIIGSSNLSAGAFSNTTPRWNQECDVIFWDETDECAQDVMNTVLEYLGEEDRKMLFVTNYNEEENNSSLEKKLMNLEQQIINKELVNVYDVGSNF